MCRRRDTPCADPDKQFLLLIDHIRRLREHVEWRDSAILVFVESNLGYESEHHERALRGMPMVRFYFDERRGRVGVTTTLPVKHAAVTLTRSLLMEGRLALVRVPHTHTPFPCTPTPRPPERADPAARAGQ